MWLLFGELIGGSDNTRSVCVANCSEQGYPAITANIGIVVIFTRLGLECGKAWRARVELLVADINLQPATAL
jgi:hypothetical protein